MRMFRIRSARTIPADVIRALGLTRADRVLAWSPLAGGGAAAATIAELVIVRPDGKLIRHPWVEVDHAAWEADSSTVAVWWVGQRIATALEVVADSGLPEVIRERVQASVLLTGAVAVPGAGGRQVRIALRVTPQGRISTQTLPPPGVKLADPEVAVAVRRGLDGLLGEAGIAYDPSLGSHSLGDDPLAVAAPPSGGPSKGRGRAAPMREVAPEFDSLLDADPA